MCCILWCAHLPFTNNGQTSCPCVVYYGLSTSPFTNSGQTSCPCVVYCGVPTSPLQTMDGLAAHVLYIMVCPPPFTNRGHTSYPCVEYCGLSTSLFTNNGRTLTTHVVDYPPPPPFILWFVHLPLYKQWTH